MKKEIEALTTKAKRSMKAARNLFKTKDYDFAVSRAYYAIFYISEALLLKKGLAFSKHAAVISGIFDTYIKGGDLPRDFHQTLHRAFDLRQQGDYLSDEPITAEVAKGLMDKIEKQIEIGMERLK